MTIVFALALVFCLGAGVWDAVLSARGIRAGLFVEGNEMLVWFAGTNKPSLRQIERFNLALTAVLSVFAAFGIPFHNAPLIYLSAVCLTTWGAKHLAGVNKAYWYLQRFGL